MNGVCNTASSPRTRAGAPEHPHPLLYPSPARPRRPPARSAVSVLPSTTDWPPPASHPSSHFTQLSCTVLRGETRTRRPAATRRAARGLGRQATEDVVEVGERVDVVVLAAAGQRVQDGRRPAPPITPQECLVPAPDRLGTQLPLGEVIVDARKPRRPGRRQHDCRDLRRPVAASCQGAPVLHLIDDDPPPSKSAIFRCPPC